TASARMLAHRAEPRPRSQGTTATEQNRSITLGGSLAAGARTPRWRSLSAGRDRHCELDGQTARQVARHRAELVDAAIVTEDVVRRQRDLGQVRDALAVSIGRIHGGAGVLREGDLRGRDLVRLARRLVEAGID